ncbi:MAG: hypothetical protein OEV92_11975 [Nitrospinota bacterium]|nr:hypothetical protein [Nitrospinota bacterium]
MENSENRLTPWGARRILILTTLILRRVVLPSGKMEYPPILAKNPASPEKTRAIRASRKPMALKKLSTAIFTL